MIPAYDPTGVYAIVADEAADCLRILRRAGPGAPFVPHRAVRQRPGSGPIQAVFHPSLARVLVCNAAGSSITVHRWDADAGTVVFAQNRGTLPLKWHGANRCAGFVLSPDGRYLYVANQGHDSLLTVAVQRGKGKIFPRTREVLAGPPNGAPFLNDAGTLLTVPGAPPTRFAVQPLNGGLTRLPGAD
jgi:6-phosphogluconolactonase